MKNFENLTADDFMYAMVNYGADPIYIEDIETAEDVMKDFIKAQFRDEFTEESDEDFEIYCRRLDLDTKTTKKVYYVHNWNEEGFEIAFIEDYE